MYKEMPGCFWCHFSRVTRFDENHVEMKARPAELRPAMRSNRESDDAISGGFDRRQLSPSICAAEVGDFFPSSYSRGLAEGRELDASRQSR